MANCMCLCDGKNAAFLLVSARFIDVSRYLSRNSYRDTVCKYLDTCFIFCSVDTIILGTETAYW